MYNIALYLIQKGPLMKYALGYLYLYRYILSSMQHSPYRQFFVGMWPKICYQVTLAT